MELKTGTCQFFIILMFLPYKCVWSGFSTKSQAKQNISPACVTYRPKVPKSLFSNNANCKREVGKVIGVPVANPPSTLEEIRLRGYHATTHTILSEDGYYSAIYRISGGPTSPPKKGKQAVLLFHGGGGGSASWIVQPGSRNLAFLLVDNGYEVWLANARGTGPSSNHTSLNPEVNLEYWDFSFEEIGTRDLPLLADLMRWVTGNKQIYYVCHSVGCALYLAGLAQLPELSSRFKAGFLLGPGAFLGSGENPFVQVQHAIVIGNPLQDIVFKILGGRQGGEPSALMTVLGLTPENFCTWSAVRCGVCDNAIFAFYGQDAQQLNNTETPNIVRKLSANLGLKVFFHGLQDLETCQFRRYNYNSVKTNRAAYGTNEPPPYNMDNVRVPLYIWAGESDNLVSPPDAARLWNNIQPEYRGGLYTVDWPLFHHIDFLMAKDADTLVYNKILDHINRIEGEEYKYYGHYDYDYYK